LVAAPRSSAPHFFVQGSRKTVNKTKKNLALHRRNQNPRLSEKPQADC
jgi:hypothetical protein